MNWWPLSNRPNGSLRPRNPGRSNVDRRITHFQFATGSLGMIHQPPGLALVPQAENLMCRFATLAISLLLALPALAGDLPIRPDPKLTPGVVRTTDAATVCAKGYSKTVRHTSGQLKAEIYREYGIDRQEGHFEVDHLISLGLGGADVAANLWPQSYDTLPWNAHVKDRLEDRLDALVCAGKGTARAGAARDRDGLDRCIPEVPWRSLIHGAQAVRFSPAKRGLLAFKGLRAGRYSGDYLGEASAGVPTDPGLPRQASPSTSGAAAATRMIPLSASRCHTAPSIRRPRVTTASAPNCAADLVVPSCVSLKRAL
jgi:hypothetical protein